MINRVEGKVKNKISRTLPGKSSNWIKNFGRSVKFASIDIFKDLAPSIYETTTNASELAKNLAQDIKEIKISQSRIQKQLDQYAAVREAKNAWKNAKADIASGNLYNQERADKIGRESMGFDDMGDDFSFDEEDTTMEFNPDSGSESSGDDSDFNMAGEVAEGVDSGLSDVKPAVKASAKASIHTAEAAGTLVSGQLKQTKDMNSGFESAGKIAQQVAITTLTLNQKYYDESTGYFKSAADNLGKLVAFNDETVSKLAMGALKFYEDQLNVSNNILAELQKISGAVVPKEEEQQNENEKSDFNRLFTGRGVFKFQNYPEVLKKNLYQGLKNSNIFGDFVNMLENPAMLAEMASHPVRIISETVVKSLIPTMITSSLKDFDKTIASFFPALMAKITNYQNSSDDFKQLFGEMFGIETDVKTSPDTSRYEKGAVPFDGITHKTINVVIPEYLAGILAAVSNKEQLAYDYESGYFTTKRNLNKKLDEDHLKTAISGFSDFKNEITDKIKEAIFFTSNQREIDFDKKLDQWLLQMVEGNKVFNPSQGDKFSDWFSNDPDFAQLMEAAWPIISKNAKLRNGFAMLQGRENLNNRYSDMDKSNGDSNTKAILMNYQQAKAGSPQANTHVSFSESGVARPIAESNPKTPYDHKEYQKGHIELLRDIKEILIEGIKVFPEIPQSNVYDSLIKILDSKGYEVLIQDKNTGNLVNNIFSNTSSSNNNGNSSISSDNIASKRYETWKKDKELMAQAKNEYEKNNDPYKRKDDESIKEAVDSKKKVIVGEGHSLKNQNISGIFNTVYSENRKEEKKRKDRAKMGGAWEALDKWINESTFGEKITSIKNAIEKFFKVPSEFLRDSLTKISDGLYTIIYGDDKGKSFIDTAKEKLKKTFEDFNNWLKKKWEAGNNYLFGEGGLFESKPFKWVQKKGSELLDFLFGKENSTGSRDGGALSGMLNTFSDLAYSIRHELFGTEYTDSEGKNHKKNTKSIMHEVTDSISNALDEMNKYLFGEPKKDANGNKISLLDSVADTLSTGFTNFSNFFFGKKMTEEEGKANFKSVSEDFKKGLPKALAVGVVGAGIGLFTNFGLLGSLILPGGPIGGAILGIATGFAAQSEKFKSFLFGAKGFDGKRAGGLIGKKVQDWFIEHKTAIVGGATFGVAKSLLATTGVLNLFGPLGAMANFLLPGGPIFGALAGAAVGIGVKSKIFQEFLYGKAGLDGVKVGGILNTKMGESLQKHLPNMAFGALSFGAAGAVIGQMGFLGALLTPGGVLGAAILGAATGIAISSDRFRKFMFGEKDEKTGLQKAGLFGKLSNIFTLSIVEPFKIKLNMISADIQFWFKKQIAIPFKAALGPLKTQLGIMGENMRKMMERGWNFIAKTIDGTFEKAVGLPLGKFLEEKVLGPMRKFMDKLVNGIGKVFGFILSSPVKALSFLASAAVRSQEKLGVKENREARNAELKKSLSSFGHALAVKVGISKAKEGEENISLKDSFSDVVTKAKRSVEQYGEEVTNTDKKKYINEEERQKIIAEETAKAEEEYRKAKEENEIAKASLDARREIAKKNDYNTVSIDKDGNVTGDLRALYDMKKPLSETVEEQKKGNTILERIADFAKEILMSSEERNRREKILAYHETGNEKLFELGTTDEMPAELKPSGSTTKEIQEQKENEKIIAENQAEKIKEEKAGTIASNQTTEETAKSEEQTGEEKKKKRGRPKKKKSKKKLTIKTLMEQVKEGKLDEATVMQMIKAIPDDATDEEKKFYNSRLERLTRWITNHILHPLGLGIGKDKKEEQAGEPASEQTGEEKKKKRGRPKKNKEEQAGTVAKEQTGEEKKEKKKRGRPKKNKEEQQQQAGTVAEEQTEKTKEVDPKKEAEKAKKSTKAPSSPNAETNPGTIAASLPENATAALIQMNQNLATIVQLLNAQKLSGTAGPVVGQPAKDAAGTVASTSDSKEEREFDNKNKVSKASDPSLKYLRIIASSVDGQLNGVGSNVYKTRKILEGAVGINGDDVGSGNKDRVTRWQRFKNFMFMMITNPIIFFGNIIKKPFEVIFGLGKKVYDTALNIVHGVGDMITGAVNTVFDVGKKIFNGLLKVPGMIVDIVGGIAEVSKEVLIEGVHIIGEGVTGLLSSGFKVIDGAIEGLSEVTKGLGKGIGSIFKGIGKVGESVLKGVGKALEGTVEVIGTVADTTIKVAGAVTESIVKISATAFEGITKVATSLITGVSDLIIGTGKTLFAIAASPFKFLGNLADGLLIRSSHVTVDGGRLDRIVEIEKVDKVVSIQGFSPDDLSRVLQEMAKVSTAKSGAAEDSGNPQHDIQASPIVVNTTEQVGEPASEQTSEENKEEKKGKKKRGRPKKKKEDKEEDKEEKAGEPASEQTGEENKEEKKGTDKKPKRGIISTMFGEKGFVGNYIRNKFLKKGQEQEEAGKPAAASNVTSDMLKSGVVNAKDGTVKKTAATMKAVTESNEAKEAMRANEEKQTSLLGVIANKTTEVTSLFGKYYKWIIAGAAALMLLLKSLADKFNLPNLLNNMGNAIGERVAQSIANSLSKTALGKAINNAEARLKSGIAKSIFKIGSLFKKALNPVLALPKAIFKASKTAFKEVGNVFKTGINKLAVVLGKNPPFKVGETLAAENVDDAARAAAKNAGGTIAAENVDDAARAAKAALPAPSPKVLALPEAPSPKVLALPSPSAAYEIPGGIASRADDIVIDAVFEEAPKGGMASKAGSGIVTEVASASAKESVNEPSVWRKLIREGLIFLEDLASKWVKKPLSFAAKIFGLIQKHLTDKIMKTYAGKLTAAAAKAIVGEGSGHAADIILGAWNAVVGLHDAARLFRVNKEAVTAGMRLCSCIVKMVMGCAWTPIIILEVALQILGAIIGWDPHAWMAQNLYMVISDSKSILELEEKQHNFEEEAKQAGFVSKDEEGNEVVDVLKYNDEVNQSLYGKIWDKFVEVKDDVSGAIDWVTGYTDEKTGEEVPNVFMRLVNKFPTAKAKADEFATAIGDTVDDFTSFVSSMGAEGNDSLYDWFFGYTKSDTGEEVPGFFANAKSFLASSAISLIGYMFDMSPADVEAAINKDGLMLFMLSKITTYTPEELKFGWQHFKNSLSFLIGGMDNSGEHHRGVVGAISAYLFGDEAHYDDKGDLVLEAEEGLIPRIKKSFYEWLDPTIEKFSLIGTSISNFIDTQIEGLTKAFTETLPENLKKLDVYLFGEGENRNALGKAIDNFAKNIEAINIIDPIKETISDAIDFFKLALRNMFFTCVYKIGSLFGLPKPKGLIDVEKEIEVRAIKGIIKEQNRSSTLKKAQENFDPASVQKTSALGITNNAYAGNYNLNQGSSDTGSKIANYVSDESFNNRWNEFKERQGRKSLATMHGSGPGDRCSMNDPDLKNKKYGSSTFEFTGCAPVSAANALNIDPEYASSFAEVNGFRDPEGTSEDFFPAIANSVGVKATKLGSIDDMFAANAIGEKIVVGGIGKDYTAAGHYSEAVPTDDGVNIIDSRGPEYDKTIDFDSFSKQTKTAYAFSGSGPGDDSSSESSSDSSSESSSNENLIGTIKEKIIEWFTGGEIFTNVVSIWSTSLADGIKDTREWLFGKAKNLKDEIAEKAGYLGSFILDKINSDNVVTNSMKNFGNTVLTGLDNYNHWFFGNLGNGMDKIQKGAGFLVENAQKGVDYLFGEKESDGYRRGGVIGNFHDGMVNKLEDTIKWMFGNIPGGQLIIDAANSGIDFIFGKRDSDNIRRGGIVKKLNDYIESGLGKIKEWIIGKVPGGQLIVDTFNKYLPKSIEEFGTNMVKSLNEAWESFKKKAFDLSNINLKDLFSKGMEIVSKKLKGNGIGDGNLFKGNGTGRKTRFRGSGKLFRGTGEAPGLNDVKGDWMPAAPGKSCYEDTTKIYRISLHHTGPGGKYTPEQEKKIDPTVQDNWNLHTNPKPKGNGWSNIGYHYQIYKNGEIWKGRDVKYEGSHTWRNNPGTIGIELNGHFDYGDPTPEQIASITHLVHDLGKKYNIPFDREHIKGHNEYPDNNTDCPGKNLTNKIDSIIENAKNGNYSSTVKSDSNSSNTSTSTGSSASGQDWDKKGIAGLASAFSEGFSGVLSNSVDSSGNNNNGGSGGNVALSDSMTPEQIWDWFISKGYTPEATGGIMGRLKQENNFSPKYAKFGNVGGVEYGGMGMFQWTYGDGKGYDYPDPLGKDKETVYKKFPTSRLVKYMKWVDENKKGNYESVGNQLEYLYANDMKDHQYFATLSRYVNNSKKSVALKSWYPNDYNTLNLEQSAVKWTNDYEIGREGKEFEYGKEIYEKFKNRAKPSGNSDANKGDKKEDKKEKQEGKKIEKDGTPVENQKMKFHGSGDKFKGLGNVMKIDQQRGKRCTIEATRSIYRAYLNKEAPGFTGDDDHDFKVWYNLLSRDLKIDSKEFKDKESFDAKVKELFDAHPDYPVFLYQTGGAGKNGNPKHKINRVSGNHATVLARRLSNGKYEDYDSNGGIVHTLDADEIFDKTAKGSASNGMTYGNALFIPTIEPTDKITEWQSGATTGDKKSGNESGSNSDSNSNNGGSSVVVKKAPTTLLGLLNKTLHEYGRAAQKALIGEKYTDEDWENADIVSGGTSSSSSDSSSSSSSSSDSNSSSSDGKGGKAQHVDTGNKLDDSATYMSDFSKEKFNKKTPTVFWRTILREETTDPDHGGPLGSYQARVWNNPGGMDYSDWQKEYGAKPATEKSAHGHIRAVFPTLQHGLQAEVDYFCSDEAFDWAKEELKLIQQGKYEDAFRIHVARYVGTGVSFENSGYSRVLREELARGENLRTGDDKRTGNKKTEEKTTGNGIGARFKGFKGNGKLFKGNGIPIAALGIRFIAQQIWNRVRSKVIMKLAERYGISRTHQLIAQYETKIINIIEKFINVRKWLDRFDTLSDIIDNWDLLNNIIDGVVKFIETGGSSMFGFGEGDKFKGNGNKLLKGLLGGLLVAGIQSQYARRAEEERNKPAGQRDNRLFGGALGIYLDRKANRRNRPSYLSLLGIDRNIFRRDREMTEDEIFRPRKKRHGLFGRWLNTYEDRKIDKAKNAIYKKYGLDKLIGRQASQEEIDAVVKNLGITFDEFGNVKGINIPEELKIKDKNDPEKYVKQYKQLQGYFEYGGRSVSDKNEPGKPAVDNKSVDNKSKYGLDKLIGRQASQEEIDAVVKNLGIKFDKFNNVEGINIPEELKIKSLNDKDMYVKQYKQLQGYFEYGGKDPNAVNLVTKYGLDKLKGDKQASQEEIDKVIEKLNVKFDKYGNIEGLNIPEELKIKSYNDKDMHIKRYKQLQGYFEYGGKDPEGSVTNSNSVELGDGLIYLDTRRNRALRNPLVRFLFSGFGEGEEPGKISKEQRKEEKRKKKEAEKKAKAERKAAEKKAKEELKKAKIYNKRFKNWTGGEYFNDSTKVDPVVKDYINDKASLLDVKRAIGVKKFSDKLTAVQQQKLGYREFNIIRTFDNFVYDAQEWRESEGKRTSVDDWLKYNPDFDMKGAYIDYNPSKFDPKNPNKPRKRHRGLFGRWLNTVEDWFDGRSSKGKMYKKYGLDKLYGKQLADKETIKKVTDNLGITFDEFGNVKGINIPEELKIKDKNDKDRYLKQYKQIQGYFEYGGKEPGTSNEPGKPAVNNKSVDNKSKYGLDKLIGRQASQEEIDAVVKNLGIKFDKFNNVEGINIPEELKIKSLNDKDMYVKQYKQLQGYFEYGGKEPGKPDENKTSSTSNKSTKDNKTKEENKPGTISTNKDAKLPKTELPQEETKKKDKVNPVVGKVDEINSGTKSVKEVDEIKSREKINRDTDIWNKIAALLEQISENTKGIDSGFDKLSKTGFSASYRYDTNIKNTGKKDSNNFGGLIIPVGSSDNGASHELNTIDATKNSSQSQAIRTQQEKIAAGGSFAYT